MLKILLMGHLIFIATGTGMSFANFINIRMAHGETGERGKALAYLRRVLAQFADIIIFLIWVSGIALVASSGGAHGYDYPAWFYVKLGFAGLLTLSHIAARLTANKMIRTGDQSLYGRMEMLVGVVWLSALAAIALAVLAFGQ